jgi:hypothetical protein
MILNLMRVDLVRANVVTVPVLTGKFIMLLICEQKLSVLVRDRGECKAGPILLAPHGR